MIEQFFTTCRRCKRQILMTRNIQNGTWVPCEPEIYRFKPGIGTVEYVTPEGTLVCGERDRDGMFGYKKHDRRKCMA